jgi:hypothetical protein
MLIILFFFAFIVRSGRNPLPVPRVLDHVRDDISIRVFVVDTLEVNQEIVVVKLDWKTTEGIATYRVSSHGIILPVHNTPEIVSEGGNAQATNVADHGAEVGGKATNHTIVVARPRS